MTVRVGVIGTGMIGRAHVRRLGHAVAGAQVVAVSDIDAARAALVAGETPGARAFPTGEALIRADEVEAVVVASWGPAHAESVLAAIAAGKPVFCEKPLAPTTAECLAILDAEQAAGRRLVQVGFMRHYDPGYVALKAALADGTLGAPVQMHSAHRNANMLPSFSDDMIINDAAIHEIDITRWLLDDEIVAARVLLPRSTGRRALPELRDPQFVLLETAAGVLSDVEVFVNAVYGYEIKCEVVCEAGTVSLGAGGEAVVRHAAQRSRHVTQHWLERFGRAYDIEFQAWVDSVAAGVATGPSAWDGYAATAIADACLQARASGERVAVQLIEQPVFYRGAAGTVGRGG